MHRRGNADRYCCSRNKGGDLTTKSLHRNRELRGQEKASGGERVDTYYSSGELSPPAVTEIIFPLPLSLSPPLFFGEKKKKNGAGGAVKTGRFIDTPHPPPIVLQRHFLRSVRTLAHGPGTPPCRQKQARRRRRTRLADGVVQQCHNIWQQVVLEEA